MNYKREMNNQCRLRKISSPKMVASAWARRPWTLTVLVVLIIIPQGYYGFSINHASSEVVIVDASPSSSPPSSGQGSLKPSPDQEGPNYNYYVTGNHRQPPSSSNEHQKKSNHHDEHGGSSAPPGEHHQLPPRRFQVAKFDFEHVSTPYIILLWIIIVGLAKMGFHVTPKLSSICPESVVLMILGVIIGLIMYFAGIPEERLQPLTPNLFFLYMLPPIVMDAGYHMPNRLFFDNLVSILLYAVVGTIWNALAIGFSLYGCSKLGAFGEEIPFLDIMLFSSTVSAVDPVAVLAVFEEIHVNEVLYILVFGESLLNDGVTVVLYHMFEGYAEMAYHYGIDSIQTIDYVSGVASFFVVAIGGTAMGVFWGFLAAFVSRFTHHVKIIEPIFVFVMAYLSYLSAEMFHLSGILSLTFCGITMKNYVEENITQKSHTTLKYAMKMLANSSEAIIFVFLGVCTVNDQHHWNTAFVTLTIFFCLLYRTIGVIGLTSVTNRFRLHEVNRVEQFIMSYGGLRGAVAFALILIINRQIIHAREMMVTTIIAVVYFTVFLQGMTVGTLVKILNVPRANKFEMTMNERIHTRLMDHVMAGLEDISGMMMGNYKLRDKFRHYNNQYLRKWLLRDSKEMGNSSRKIFETCSRLDLRDAMTLVSRQHLLATTAAAAINGNLGGYSNVNFMADDEYGSMNNNNMDQNNNNNNNNRKPPPGGGPGILPRIFLTVPGNPAMATSNPLLDPSLQTLLRSYTQSNLSALNEDGGTMNDDSDPPLAIKATKPLSPQLDNHHGNLLIPGAGFIETTIPSDMVGEEGVVLPMVARPTKEFNYDIGTMAYSPSLKDLKDAELHHILNDAMFKPFKKAHHYTRSDYHEEPSTHPPFQHQVRMQIRRLISEKETEKRRRHSHHHDYPHQVKIRHPNQHHNSSHQHHHQHPHYHQQIQHPSQSEKDQSKKSQTDRIESSVEHQKHQKRHLVQPEQSKEDKGDFGDDEDDDGGITFVVKHHSHPTEQRKVDNEDEDEGDDDVFHQIEDCNQVILDGQTKFNKEQNQSPPNNSQLPVDQTKTKEMKVIDQKDINLNNSDSNISKATKPAITNNFPWSTRRTSSVATNSETSEIADSSITCSSISSQEVNQMISMNGLNQTGDSFATLATGPPSIKYHSHHKHRKLKEGVVRQREFPPWIKNREYVDDYSSPTITLLERINFFDNISKEQQQAAAGYDTGTPTTATDQSSSSRNSSRNDSPAPPPTNQHQHHGSGTQKKVPSVYEIFQLNREQQGQTRSEDQTAETKTKPSKQSTNDDESSNDSSKATIKDFGSNDTVIEFLPRKKEEPEENSKDNDDNDELLISKL